MPGRLSRRHFFREKIMNTRIPSPIKPQNQEPPHPQDGSQLLEVLEEQQYISQQENHLLPGSSRHPAGQPERKQQ